MAFSFLDLLGLIGVTLIIGNYARLQWRREYAKEMAYSLGNLAGTALMMLSLVEKWNFSAFAVNAIMAIISVYGIYRCLTYVRINKRQKKRPHKTVQKF